VDIRKALAEGRKPVPGPPVSEKDVPDGEVDMTCDTEVCSLLSIKLCCSVKSQLDPLHFPISIV
jgi:hypothetical protein